MTMLILQYSVARDHRSFHHLYSWGLFFWSPVSLVALHKNASQCSISRPKSSPDWREIFATGVQDWREENTFKKIFWL